MGGLSDQSNVTLHRRVTPPIIPFGIEIFCLRDPFL